VTIRFVDAAEAELDEVIRYYEGEASGLGVEFLGEVMAALNRIAAFPEAWQVLLPEIRRCRLKRFPYGVIYSKANDDLIVLAVAHLHRKPENWRERLLRKR
jgi:plasmid stabilization system protein ParE